MLEIPDSLMRACKPLPFAANAQAPFSVVKVALESDEFDGSVIQASGKYGPLTSDLTQVKAVQLTKARVISFQVSGAFVDFSGNCWSNPAWFR